MTITKHDFCSAIFYKMAFHYVENIELEELKDKFTILFQIVDKDFKNRGWMKRFYFSNRQELLTIEEKIQDYLGKIEEA